MRYKGELRPPPPLSCVFRRRARLAHSHGSTMKRSRDDDAVEEPAPAGAPSYAEGAPAASAAATSTEITDAGGTFSGTPAPPADVPPPPSVEELLAAQFWYYEGQDAMLQGPFSTQHMRAWFLANYLAFTLPVAPSWYGEVPTTFWRICDLWPAAVARDKAFAGSSATIAADYDAKGPDFMEQPFEGAKDGYAYRTDVYGTGYYRDTPPAVDITAEDIEAEKAARKAKAMNFKTHIAPTGADFREHK